MDLKVESENRIDGGTPSNEGSDVDDASVIVIDVPSEIIEIDDSLENPGYTVKDDIIEIVDSPTVDYTEVIRENRKLKLDQSNDNTNCFSIIDDDESKTSLKSEFGNSSSRTKQSSDTVQETVKSDNERNEKRFFSIRKSPCHIPENAKIYPFSFLEWEKFLEEKRNKSKGTLFPKTTRKRKSFEIDDLYDESLSPSDSMKKAYFNSAEKEVDQKNNEGLSPEKSEEGEKTSQRRESFNDESLASPTAFFNAPENEILESSNEASNDENDSQNEENEHSSLKIKNVENSSTSSKEDSEDDFNGESCCSEAKSTPNKSMDEIFDDTEGNKNSTPNENISVGLMSMYECVSDFDTTQDVQPNNSSSSSEGNSSMVVNFSGVEKQIMKENLAPHLRDHQYVRLYDEVTDDVSMVSCSTKQNKKTKHKRQRENRKHRLKQLKAAEDERRAKRRFEKRERRKKKREEALEELRHPDLVDPCPISLFYMKTECPKGDDCEYSHQAMPPNQNVTEAKPPNQSHQSFDVTEAKTKRAGKHKRQRENRKNRLKQLKAAEDERRAKRRFEKRERRKKKREEALEELRHPDLVDPRPICLFYMKTKCLKGDDCPYSHQAVPPMKLTLCKFFLRDECTKRDKCLYMHEEFPCKFYHTGQRCIAYEQNRCKFSHGPALNEPLKKVLFGGDY